MFTTKNTVLTIHFPSFSFHPQPGDYSVSVKAPGKIKHFKVKNNQAQYCIGTRQFDTLDDLVDHYKRAPIFSSTNGSFKLYLTRPFSGGH